MKLQKKHNILLFFYFFILFFANDVNSQVINKCISLKNKNVIFTDIDCPNGYEKDSTLATQKNEFNVDAIKKDDKNLKLVDQVSYNYLDLFLSYKNNGNHELVMKTVWSNTSDESLTLLMRIFVSGSKSNENYVINKFIILKPKSKIDYSDVILTVGGDFGIKFKPLKANLVYFIKDESIEKWVNDLVIK